MNKRKISIITLGCKVNQYESSSIAKALEDNGFIVHQSLENADAFVLNTCAVTNEAERKSRGMIAKIRKLNETAPIFVCGCSSQHNPDIFKKYSGVKAIYGTSNKFELVDLIKSKLNVEAIEKTDISNNFQDNYTAKSERTRAVIKIQEGCNNFCSYCLIPYLRGRERSRDIESVRKEVEFQAKTSKEIVFTGINLSAYGKEFGLSLKDIALLMQNYKNVRFQFSSLEQNIITDDLLEVLSKTENFCPHFHLSLQSGCDKTLKAMNRKYLAKDYYKKVELIRKYFKNPSITTDIIVGFPTETEEDFEESYNFAKKCRFSKIHVFPFSLRSGTMAEKLVNVATNVKERVKKLSDLDKQMFEEYILSNIGQIHSVIIEERQENHYVGHTENYIKCYINPSKKLDQNDLVKVKIDKFYKDGAIASIVSY